MLIHPIKILLIAAINDILALSLGSILLSYERQRHVLSLTVFGTSFYIRWRQAEEASLLEDLGIITSAVPLPKTNLPLMAATDLFDNTAHTTTSTWIAGPEQLFNRHFGPNWVKIA